jgi:hypothetical protein
MSWSGRCLTWLASTPLAFQAASPSGFSWACRVLSSLCCHSKQANYISHSTGSFRGAPPVALTEISTPERHLKLHWVRKKGRHGTSSLFIRNTGLDPAKLL